MHEGRSMKNRFRSRSGVPLLPVDTFARGFLHLPNFVYSHYNLYKVCDDRDLYFHKDTTKRQFVNALETLMEKGDSHGPLDPEERATAEKLVAQVGAETDKNREVRRT